MSARGRRRQKPRAVLDGGILVVLYDGVVQVTDADMVGRADIRF